jgi:ribosomal protein L32
MAIKCPVCGEANARHRVARSEYSPVAVQMIGGFLLAWVFEFSRKRRFRCDRCGEFFFSHTLGSRLWLAFWILFWICFATAMAAMLMEVAGG